MEIMTRRTARGETKDWLDQKKNVHMNSFFENKQMTRESFISKDVNMLRVV